MEAAIVAVHRGSPQHLVVAVPVGSPEACARLSRLADEFICLSTPERFEAVGLAYETFSQTTDAEVTRCLA